IQPSPDSTLFPYTTLFRSRYLRHGYTTRGEVSTWYRDYFSAEANQLLGILVDNQLIGYCTIEHIDRDNHKCEVGIVIGEKDYWRSEEHTSELQSPYDLVCR